MIAPNSFTCVFQVGGAAVAYSWHTPALTEPYGISPCLAGKKFKRLFPSFYFIIYFLIIFYVRELHGEQIRKRKQPIHISTS